MTEQSQRPPQPYRHSIREDFLRPRLRNQQPFYWRERCLRAGTSLRTGLAHGRFIGSGVLVGFGCIAILIAIITWYSSEPVWQLNVKPPAAFMALRVPGIADNHMWAADYWNCARAMRSKYTYGASLPETPPTQFSSPLEATLPPDVANRVRLAYWAQLRREWLDPNAWEQRRSF